MSPNIFRKDVETPSWDEPCYNVYDRETGELLGQVIRRESTPAGYHGAWESNVIAVRDNRRADGTLLGKVRLRAAGETRDQCAQDLRALRARTEAQA